MNITFYNSHIETISELVKCINCEKWVDIDWMCEFGSDFVCEECINDGFGL